MHFLLPRSSVPLFDVEHGVGEKEWRGGKARGTRLQSKKGKKEKEKRKTRTGVKRVEKEGVLEWPVESSTT